MSTPNPQSPTPEAPNCLKCGRGVSLCACLVPQFDGPVKPAPLPTTPYPAPTPHATLQAAAEGADKVALLNALALARAALERDLRGAPKFDGYYNPHRKALAAIVALNIEAAKLEEPGL